MAGTVIPMSSKSPIERTVRTNVDRVFSEVEVQLTREVQTSRDTRHDNGAANTQNRDKATARYPFK